MGTVIIKNTEESDEEAMARAIFKLQKQLDIAKDALGLISMTKCDLDMSFIQKCPGCRTCIALNALQEIQNEE